MVKRDFRHIFDNNEDIDPIVVKKRYMIYEKYVYTLIICFIHFAFGIANSTIGPTLVDLKYILDTQMDKISLIVIFQSAGLMAGSLFGFLYKYINRQLILITLLAIMSMSCLLIPYSESLWHLYLYNWSFGFGAGAWINAKNVWAIELWHHRSAPVLQITALMFSIGSILGPLIADPYLTGHISATNATKPLNMTAVEENRMHSIRSPYLISAVILLIGPILLVIMYFLRKYENFSQKYDQIFDQKDLERKMIVNKQPYLKVALIALVAVFLAFHMSSEQNTQLFSSTYFQDIPLKLSASASAEIVSAMGLANTVGLVLSVLVSTRVRTQYMIGYHLLVIFAALNILFLVESSQLMLYIGSLLLAFGFSAIYPTIYAFTAQYIDITDSVGTVFMISSISLNLFLPFIIGLYIEDYFYVLLMSIAFNLFITIVVFIFLLQLVFKYCK